MLSSENNTRLKKKNTQLKKIIQVKKQQHWLRNDNDV